MLQINFDEYFELSDPKSKKWNPNMILIIYFLRHNYDAWFENEQSTDGTKDSVKELLDISNMPALEGD